MTVDNANNVVAAAAVTSPWWLPGLQTWSEVAALLLPIAGLVWLIIQIVGYLFKRDKRLNLRKGE